MGSAANAPGSVRLALRHALTSSFGSIAFAAAILTALRIIRNTMRRCARDNIICCIINCFVQPLLALAVSPARCPCVVCCLLHQICCFIINCCTVSPPAAFIDCILQPLLATAVSVSIRRFAADAICGSRFPPSPAAPVMGIPSMAELHKVARLSLFLPHA